MSSKRCDHVPNLLHRTGSPRIDTPEVRRLCAAAADLRSGRVNDLIREWNIEDVHLDGSLAWPHLPEREWVWMTSMRR